MTSADDTHPPTTAPSVRAALACAVLLWIVPFVQPLAWKPMLHFFHEWFAAVLGLGACAVLVRRTPHPDDGTTVTVIGLLALAALLALQPLWLRLPWWQPSFVQVVMTAWVAALVAAGARLRDLLGARTLADAIAAGVAAGAVLSALAGMVQWFAPADVLAGLIPRTGNAANLMGLVRHQSWFADHLLLGIVGLAWMAGRGRVSPFVVAPALATIAVPLSISGSRATLLQLLLLLGLALIAHRARRDDHELRRAGGWLAAATIACLAAIAAGPSWWPSVGSTAARLSDSVEAMGFSTRIELWRRAVDAIAAAPLAGHGPDGYPWAAFRSATSGAAEEYTIHAHNLLLQAGVAGGLPAIACMTVVLGGVIVGALRAWRANAPWLPAALLAVILVRSAFDLPTAFAFFAAPAALLAGLLPAPRLSLPRRLRVPTPAIAMALVAGLGLTAHTLWSYHEFAGLWRTTESAARRTERLGHASANPYLAAVAGGVAIDAATLVRAKAPRLLAASSRTVRWRPYPHATFRHGLLLALAGRTEESCRWLAHAMRVYPNAGRRFAETFEMRGADPVATRAIGWMRDPVAGKSEVATCELQKRHISGRRIAP